jgi:uncharacterized protein
MSQTDRLLIDAFLAEKRIAFVGVSRGAKDFSRMLFRELAGRGYDVVPVHPEAADIEGVPAFRTVLEIPAPRPKAALLLNPPQASEQVVRECAEAGIEMVWLYKSVALGAVTPEAVAAAKALNLKVIAGECPFMFLPNPGLIHALHRGFRRITGTLPLAPPRA